MKINSDDDVYVMSTTLQLIGPLMAVVQTPLQPLRGCFPDVSLMITTPSSRPELKSQSAVSVSKWLDWRKINTNSSGCNGI